MSREGKGSLVGSFTYTVPQLWYIPSFIRAFVRRWLNHTLKPRCVMAGRAVCFQRLLGVETVLVSVLLL